MILLYVDFIVPAFIEYMVVGKTLLGFTNLFFSYNYQKNKNNKITCKYFQDKYAKRSLNFR